MKMRRKGEGENEGGGRREEEEVKRRGLIEDRIRMQKLNSINRKAVICNDVFKF